jgi:hypothetical protein
MTQAFYAHMNDKTIKKKKNLWERLMFAAEWRVEPTLI